MSAREDKTSERLKPHKFAKEFSNPEKYYDYVVAYVTKHAADRKEQLIMALGDSPKDADPASVVREALGAGLASVITAKWRRQQRQQELPQAQLSV